MPETDLSQFHPITEKPQLTVDTHTTKALLLTETYNAALIASLVLWLWPSSLQWNLKTGRNASHGIHICSSFVKNQFNLSLLLPESQVLLNTEVFNEPVADMKATYRYQQILVK
jgi:hypothetical protein